MEFKICWAMLAGVLILGIPALAFGVSGGASVAVVSETTSMFFLGLALIAFGTFGRRKCGSCKP